MGFGIRIAPDVRLGACVPEDGAERWGRRLSVPMLAVALLVLPALVIEESSVGPVWHSVAVDLNWAVWVAFAGELAWLLWVAPNRLRWIREHPLDVAIVILTPPFGPAALQGARALRLLRVMRLLRLVRLSRQVFSLDGLRYAALLTLSVVLVGGAAFAAAENGHHVRPVSLWDGLWWAVSTVTTVGYGDLSPVTNLGRVLAMLVMFTGIGFVAVLTAAAAQRFMAHAAAMPRSEPNTPPSRHEAEMMQRLEALTAEVARLREDVASAPSRVLRDERRRSDVSLRLTRCRAHDGRSVSRQCVDDRAGTYPRGTGRPLRAACLRRAGNGPADGELRCRDGVRDTGRGVREPRRPPSVALDADHRCRPLTAGWSG
jgi:voltage-gated potassium channel